MRPLLAACFVLSVLVASHEVLAETLVGRVVRVVDGDTLVVLGPGNSQHKIRLAGIDAPERGQPYGRASGRHPVPPRPGKHGM